jgi:GLPGLI family protein
MGSNLFIFRCGKTMGQYFCYESLRHDSLSSVPGGSKILYDEIMAWTSNPTDYSKWPTSTPSKGDYLYTNLESGEVTTYCSIMGDHYRIIDNPKMKWNINGDSVKNILGYDCRLAETYFRGRHWKVWFTIDIPLPYGPWKFRDLPGMILQAECPGFLNIESYKISIKGLSPVTFYNFYNHKYSDIDRVKYLKAKSPDKYPKGTLVTPQMELE